jgi:hypothetical protein
MLGLSCKATRRSGALSHRDGRVPIGRFAAFGNYKTHRLRPLALLTSSTNSHPHQHCFDSQPPSARSGGGYPISSRRAPILARASTAYASLSRGWHYISRQYSSAVGVLHSGPRGIYKRLRRLSCCVTCCSISPTHRFLQLEKHYTSALH